MGAERKRGSLEIALFARAPILGLVKRRLAAGVGEAEALRVYEELLSLSIDAAVEACSRRGDLVPVLWHHGVWPDSFPLPSAMAADMRRQPSFDMLENLRAVFAIPGGSRRRGAIVFGADHPDLEADHILKVAALLDDFDVAIGAAEDGGFWALGAVVDLGDVLCALPLGKGDACSALVEAVRGAGLSCGFGPTLCDVDTAEDLARCRLRMHRA